MKVEIHLPCQRSRGLAHNKTPLEAKHPTDIKPNREEEEEMSQHTSLVNKHLFHTVRMDVVNVP